MDTNLFYKHVGKKLKKARILKGLTQEELAKRTNLSADFIDSLERGKEDPFIFTIFIICRELQIPFPDVDM